MRVLFTVEGGAVSGADDRKTVETDALEKQPTET
jgi:hypothetical protein